MYYPYLRGKQYELILIREKSQLMAENSFIPILEPVKSNLSGLRKAVVSLNEAECHFILISNPAFGHHKDGVTEEFTQLLNKAHDHENCIVGHILGKDANLDELSEFLGQHDKNEQALIHYGFPKASAIAEVLHKANNTVKNIFVEDYAGPLYRKKFIGLGERVLLRDGFRRQKNRDYGDHGEKFSDLHLLYVEMGMQGYGDYLIVGDDYQETGGPAYAVAIHLTYIDDEDDEIFVKHYVSDTNESAKDPGAKFLEAVGKLVTDLDQGTFRFETEATGEFRNLLKEKHYPGLGYVKKLSMQHHIELIAQYLQQL